MTTASKKPTTDYAKYASSKEKSIEVERDAQNTYRVYLRTSTEALKTFSAKKEHTRQK